MNGYIYAVMKGHVVAIEYGTTDQLKERIEFLNSHDDMFRALLPALFANTAELMLKHLPANGSAAPGDAPVCPAHNKPMKPSKNTAGEWYCPTKTDGKWCQHKVKK